MIARHGWRVVMAAAAAALAITATFLFALSGPGQHYLSPGELRGRHASKVGKCSACHDPFFGVPDVNCEKCHKPVAKARLARHGRHAGMVGPCVDCHFMHRRLGQPAMAIDPRAVDHDLMRFTMAGHEKQACRSCHGARFNRFSRTESRRCVGCHQRLQKTRRARSGRQGVAWAAGAPRPDFKRHVRGAGSNCVRCHRGGPEVEYQHTGSRDFFGRKHAEVKCARCHRNDNYLQESRACRNCHKKGHGRDYSGCRRCHSPAGWRPASPDHAGRLQGKHTGLKCAGCHPGKDFGRYAGSNWACAACHQTAHAGATVADCQRCHGQIAWKPARMDHAAATQACAGCHQPPTGHYPGGCSSCHSTRAWKPARAAHGVNLGGDHTRLACAACHPGGRYSGLSWSCSACHSAPHSGYGYNCGACHNQSGWRPASFSHNGVSGDCSACHRPPGNHNSGSCRQCHTTAGSWKAAGGNHPQIEEHSSTSFPCADCHPSGYASVNCTGCHESGGDGEDED